MSHEKIDRSCVVQVHPKGTKIQDTYELPKSNDKSKALGTGSFGSVMKGTHKSSKMERAIKKIDAKELGKKPGEKAKMDREINIMKEVDHPNIVRLHETYEDAQFLYLVMELCLGGELFDRIIDAGYFSEHEAAITMKQILSAIFYLHERSITHRDLKPENFLLETKAADSQLKVIDFGLSCKFEHGKHLKSKAGTPYYVAPQVLQGSYCEKADVWSCGVMMYVLLCGYPPFYGDDDGQILAMVRKGEYDYPEEEWEDVSNEAKSLVDTMLKMDEAKRIAAGDALKHAWFLKEKEERGKVSAAFVSKLRTFRGQSKLKKIALTVIAMNTMPDQIKELRTIFKSLDVNGDGTLTYKEVIDTMKDQKIEVPEDLLAIMKDVDSDGNGNIDYTEFVAATLDKSLYLAKDKAWAAFCSFDLDGDGKITQEELTKVLGADGLEDHFDQQKIKSLIEEADKNHDGVIDYDEFLAAMKLGS